jgi:hypothetical protein
MPWISSSAPADLAAESGKETMNAISDTLGHPEDMAQERLPLLARPHYWVVTVDHGRLGVMYIFTGLAFVLIGGVEASLIR